MPYHLLRFGDEAWGGKLDTRLSLGKVELGSDFPLKPPIAEPLERYGGRVVVLWQSAAPTDPDYLIVAGEIEPTGVDAAVADTEYVLADFRRIVAPGLVGPRSDAAIRTRLEMASIGSEDEPCPVCGMFGGLHVEPPPLPH